MPAITAVRSPRRAAACRSLDSDFPWLRIPSADLSSMPESASKPVYLVDAYSDPVVVRIDGRASFQNSTCLRDFITEMLARGKTRFVLDFQHCASMDSTFLGVLAGAAIELKKSAPGGSIVVTRVGPRNLEL